MGRAGGRPSSPPSPPPTPLRVACPPGPRLAVVWPSSVLAPVEGLRPAPVPRPLQSAPPPSSFSSGLCRSAPRPAPARPHRFLWVPLPSSTALVPGSLHTDLITVLLIMCYVQPLLGWKLPEDRHLTSLPPDARHSASPGTG